LSDNDCGHDLLPQLGLSLLDSRHDHISNTTSRQTVKTRTDTLDGDDVEISCTAVIAAVHDRTTVPPVSQTISGPSSIHIPSPRLDIWRANDSKERTQADRGSS
jgi:hypothetical protein